jgi:uracil phosphoribosyltransferase
MRDENIQKDSFRFRANMERVGTLIAYEISKTLSYRLKDLKTPLGIASENILKDKIVLSTILRAGLPLNRGFLNVFDKAENAFVSAFRKYHSPTDFEIKIEYISAPSIKDKILILSDPMLATGASMVMAYRALIKKGIPKHTHIVALLASKEGLEYLKKNINNDNVTVWVAAIDDELTVQSYIVPGLGDAGDLAFGEKE